MHPKSLYGPNPDDEDHQGKDAGQWLAGAAKDVGRAITGYNEWTQSIPTQVGGYFGVGDQGMSPGYDEASYQQALAAYQANPAAFPNGPPSPPEADPRLANLNLQRNAVNPLVGQLENAAAGNGPSQAQNQLREGTATAISSQYGAAATPSVGGAAQAALYANAQNNAAGLQQAGARQSAQLRAQEMTDARQQLANTLSAQQGVNNTAAQQNLQQRLGNQQSAVGIEGLNQKTGQENKGGLLGGVLGAIGGMFSDVRAKEDIRPMGDSPFLPTIGPVGAGYGAGASGAMPPPPVAATPAPDASTTSAAPWWQSQQAPEKKDGLGGFLSQLSDARSKEKIRTLETALADANQSADTIRGTDVAYPDLGPRPEAPPASPGDGFSPTFQGRLAAWPAEDMNRSSLAAHFGRAGTPQGYREASTFEDLASPAGSRRALAPVAPYEYRYKPEFAAATGADTAPRAGIMAQELEQSPNPALRSAVVDTPIGKAIDGKRAVSANLALSAGLDKRLRAIEGAFARPTVYPGAPNPAAETGISRARQVASDIGDTAVQYPNLVMSDQHSKEAIRSLSGAVEKLAAVAPASTTASIPEGRMVTPDEETIRKYARMRNGADPYADQRAAIDAARMAPPQYRDPWSNDVQDPHEQIPQYQMAPPVRY